MKLTTVRFGEIDIDESRIFDFVLPLIGFDMLKKFVILEPNKDQMASICRRSGTGVSYYISFKFEF